MATPSRCATRPCRCRWPTSACSKRATRLAGASPSRPRWPPTRRCCNSCWATSAACCWPCNAIWPGRRSARAWPASPARRHHARPGCPLEFNAGQTRLHFARDWLDQPPPGAHAPTFRLIEQACDAILNRIGMDGGIIGAVQRMLLTQPQRLATIEQMAGQLGLHPRTLRRRIAHEGASYRDIVDQLRFRLAARYLADSDLTHEAISEQLGFSDASSFRRAFKRWARQSPQAFRHGGK